MIPEFAILQFYVPNTVELGPKTVVPSSKLKLEQRLNSEKQRFFKRGQVVLSEVKKIVFHGSKFKGEEYDAKILDLGGL